MHNKIWAITETSPQHGRPQLTQLLLNRFPANWIYDQIKINRKSQHTWHVHSMTSLTLGVSRVTGKNLKLKLSVRITPWKISSPFSHDSPDFPSPFFFFEVMTWLKWIWRPLIQTSLIIRNGNYRPFSDLRSTLFVISRLQPESIEWAANKAAVLPNSFSPRLCFSPLCWFLCSSKMVGICLAESLENLSHLCIVRAGNNIDRNFMYRNSPLIYSMFDSQPQFLYFRRDYRLTRWTDMPVQSILRSFPIWLLFCSLLEYSLWPGSLCILLNVVFINLPT